jgi:hypothetical protein
MDHDWVFMTPVEELSFVTATAGSVTTAGTGTFTDSAMTDTTGTHDGSSIRILRSNGSTFYATIATQTSSGVFTFADGSLVFATTDTYTIVASPAIRGEAHRYLMPSDFGGIIRGRIQYGGPAGTPRTELLQIDVDEISALNAGENKTTGDPVTIGFRPLTQDSPSEQPRFEALVWPTPGTARTITYRYRRQPVALVNGTDRPVSYAMHDMTLLAAVKAEAERTRHDETSVELDNYKQLLTQSKALDAQMRPKRKGFMSNPESGAGAFPFSLGTVDSYNGTDLTF